MNSADSGVSSRIASNRAALLASGLGCFALACWTLGCGPARTVTAPTTSGGTDATYEVRLHRAAIVGKQHRIVTHGEHHETSQVRVGGKIEKNTREDAVIAFRAVERVVSITDQGKSKRDEYTVEQFETTPQDGTATVLVAPGQVLTVDRGKRSEDTVVTLNGAAVPKPVKQALGLVISMSNGGAVDDDIFGSTTRRAIGASWPIHGAVVASDFALGTGIQATFTGETQLLQRTTLQNTDCLEFRAQMNGTVSKMPDMPEGTTIRTGTMIATFGGFEPLDLTSRALKNATSIEIHIVMELPAKGQRAEVELTTRDRKEETITAL